MPVGGKGEQRAQTPHCSVRSETHWETNQARGGMEREQAAGAGPHLCWDTGTGSDFPELPPSTAFYAK